MRFECLCLLDFFSVRFSMECLNPEPCGVLRFAGRVGIFGVWVSLAASSFVLLVGGVVGLNCMLGC